MKIKGLDFYCTCNACPEQYEVYDIDSGRHVGYVRLRWGALRCDYPDTGGETIYYANIGDGWTGNFESEEQRIEHLNNIADKIIEKMFIEAICT